MTGAEADATILTGWAESPMLAFDLETTGPDPVEARIVTASLVFIRPGNRPATRDWLADPGVEIPAGATEVHGITTEHARAHGQPAADVVQEVADLIGEAWTEGWGVEGTRPAVVAFNASYDLTVLHHEVARHGLVSPFTDATGPVIDPFVLDKHVDRYRRGSRRLADTCAHYGITLKDAHTSSADALAAAKLARQIAHRYPAVGSMPIADLHAAQCRWYREAQLSFGQYLRGKAAQGVLAEAIRLSGEDRAAKLADLPGLLDRADTVTAEAAHWPLRKAAR